MGYELGDEILRRLRGKLQLSSGEFVALSARRDGDPFRVLVAVIISQNTSERNAFEAFGRLSSSVGLTPEAILKAGVDAVREAIRPAGLQDSKSAAIVEAARLTLEKYGGDLRRLLELGEEAVRRELTAVRGIGYKTVDVLLASFGYPVLPVDTHVRRVARRLGLSRSSSYLGIRRDLERVFRPEVRFEAHLLLIKLGREVCKAREPCCADCPLSDLCAYYRAQLRAA
jgi:endonuclease-3